MLWLWSVLVVVGIMVVVSGTLVGICCAMDRHEHKVGWLVAALVLAVFIWAAHDVLSHEIGGI